MLKLSFLLLLVTGSYLFWSYWHPLLPNNIRKTLFEGITYIRGVRRTPRPIIFHVVMVDLTQPNLSFLVTPGEVTKNGKIGKIGARTTSQFLAEFNLQVAVNGSFFYPFSEKIWSAYPRYAGDPIHPVGFASSRGQVYSQSKPNFETFYISADNQAQFQVPIGTVYNAISGSNLLIKQGKMQSPFIGKFNASERPYPRTALALDKAAKTLMIFVVDGKQRNYSEGVTLVELVEIVQAYGGDTALNMDGGGSSTLVMEGTAGKPIVLNSPIHTRIRGRERLVANHLGIYTQRRQL